MKIKSTSAHPTLAALFVTAAIISSACRLSPAEKSARSLENGKQLLAKKEIRRAILEFRNSVQSTPKNAESYYQLSLAYFAAGDLNSGVANLRKTLELNPAHKPAQLRIAQLMSMASDTSLVKEAQERLTKMLTESPDNAEAIQILAFTQVKLGDVDEAVENLGRALALAPQDVMIAVSLSNAKLRQADLKGAEEVLKKASERSPKSAQAAFFLGKFYENRGRVPEAEAQYSRALSIDPQNSEALYDLGMMEDRTGRKQEAEQSFKQLSTFPGSALKTVHALYLFQEGRHDEAIRELEALAKSRPDDRVVRTRLVAAQRAAGKPDDAEKTLDAALKRNPKDSDALLQRAETLVASRKFGPAERDLNEVIRLNPDSATAHYVLAKFHQSKGENLTYRQELMKALQLNESLTAVRIEAAQNLVAAGDAKAALTLLDQAPAVQKTMTSLSVQRNWTLWAMGDIAEMRKGIDQGLSRERNTELLLQDGIWKLRAGQYIPARASLEEALKINPGDVRALKALNTSYVAQKQNSAALQKVKEYAARQPKAAPVQEFLAMLLIANGQLQEARGAFEAAKTADPGYARADLSLTQLDVVEGRWNDARRRLDTILATDHSNTTARLWLGNMDASQGNLSAATEEFRQVVGADPGNAQALNNFAYLLSQSDNQLTEALKYAQKAKELSPDKAEYADTLGWIFYRQGLYPSAIRELISAVGNGESPISKYHLAMAYAKAGDRSRAQTYLQAALRQNPRLPEANQAQQVVASGPQK